VANAASGAGNVAGPQAPGAGGQNPFQIATNLYAEKNLQGAVSSQQLGANSIVSGGSVNAGQYLRGIRLQVRTLTNGSVSGATNTDLPWSVFQGLDITNVDGSEILYNMPGYSYYASQKYFRPWLQDPSSAYDFQGSAASPNTLSFTLFLQPEVRFTAGVLANTDTRSQYRYDYTLGAGPTVFGTGATITTEPILTMIPYMDAWAQPDAQDLQGTANQPVPPGVNLQTKRRHQIFTLNATGSDNTLLSTLTGNAIRAAMFITRSSAGLRADGFSDPIYWQLDNRSLGRLNPDIVRQWQQDFYATLNRNNLAAENLSGAGLYAGAGSGDTGVYVFPRWIEPGELMGQGWLYTANSTKLYWESVSQAAVTGGTAELICDEVYPVGNVDPALVDI
jgi:hypothetical protein